MDDLNVYLANRINRIIQDIKKLDDAINQANYQKETLKRKIDLMNGLIEENGGLK